MHKLLLELPTRLETERLYLRPYQPGDGEWYYAMSLKNKEHLQRYEPHNAVITIQSVEDAEVVMRDMALDFAARNCFFMGAFDKQTGEFVAQLYIGAVSWALPEFQIGYFVEQAHQGQGYVTEAVQAALKFIFEHLSAQRASLQCSDTNERSYRVAERCGMLREGHFRQNKYLSDGVFEGTLYYGLLRSEWLAR
jgi:RimJ/RimL family protein N-acetyltransferase